MMPWRIRAAMIPAVVVRLTGAMRSNDAMCLSPLEDCCMLRPDC
jgi:hypothetical protein